MAFIFINSSHLSVRAKLLPVNKVAIKGWFLLPSIIQANTYATKHNSLYLKGHSRVYDTPKLGHYVFVDPRPSSSI